MAAAATDLFKKLTNNFSTTLSGAIVGAGDTSMSLGSTTNLASDTGIVLVVDRVNASGVATPLLREYIKGTVSGSTIINLVRGVGNSTAQAHLSGAVVEQVVDQTTINDISNGILVHANQDGTLRANSVNTAQIANLAVTSAQIAPGGINYANLLTTIFGGQVQTYTSTGNGNGTGYYINLGGIKLCWGQTGGFGTTAGNNYSVSLPTSFFTTVQSGQLSVFTPTNASTAGTLAFNVLTTTAIGGFINTTNTTMAFQWFVIGT